MTTKKIIKVKAWAIINAPSRLICFDNYSSKVLAIFERKKEAVAANSMLLMSDPIHIKIVACVITHRA